MSTKPVMSVADIEAAVVADRAARLAQQEAHAHAEREFAAQEAKRATLRRLHGVCLSKNGAEGEVAVRIPVAGGPCRARWCDGLLADRSSSVAVLVCHPWGPLGGSMNDLNVVALCDTLGRRGGLTTLRFNFRSGLGRGHAAADDVRAAWDYLRSLDSPPSKLLLVGYSYGACVAADAAPGLVGALAGLVMVAPPIGASLFWLFLGRDVLSRCQAALYATPKLLLIGSDDQFCSQERFVEFARGCRGPTTWQVVHGEPASCGKGGCGEGGCHTNSRVDHFSLHRYFDEHLEHFVAATYGCELESLGASDGVAIRGGVAGLSDGLSDGEGAAGERKLLRPK